MYRYLSLAIVALCWVFQLQAQTYSGRGSLILETQGTQDSTRLVSQQVGASYQVKQEKMQFYLKPQSLALGESPAVAEMLRECLLTDSYPLIKMSFAVETFNTLDNTTLDIDGAVLMMDQDFEVNTTLRAEKDSENPALLLLSGSFSLDLRRVQVQIPQEYEDRFGHMITFKLNRFPLSLR